MKGKETIHTRARARERKNRVACCKKENDMRQCNPGYDKRDLAMRTPREKIDDLRAAGYSDAAIAAYCQVNQSTIWRIRKSNGKQGRYVTIERISSMHDILVGKRKQAAA